MWLSIGHDFVNLDRVIWIEDKTDRDGIDIFLHLTSGKSVRAEGAEATRIKRLLVEMVNGKPRRDAVAVQVDELQLDRPHRDDEAA